MPQYLSWEAIEAIVRGAYRVLLFGPPGTGKTTSAYTAATELKKSIYNITLSDETPAAELRGHYVPQGSKFVWMDGPAIRAFREGAILLLDEIDKASQDCLDFLHGLLNDPTLARLTLPTGEIVTPGDGFQVVATMNGELDGLQPSLQDRFSIAIEVTEPHPGAIASLPEDLRGAASKVEAYDAQQRPATIRRWAAFASLRELPDVGIENAAKAVFAHRATEIMDAYGFRAGLTVVEEEVVVETPDEDDCSCASCVEDRSRAWMTANYGSNYPEQDPDDETWQCPNCSEWHDTENEALRCCFDDASWIDLCRSQGRSTT